MQIKAPARKTLALLFAASMLFAQNAHAGWILDWIKCSEDCGWICDCDGGAEAAFRPQNPRDKKASEEIMKAMKTFKSEIRSLSPDARNLLRKAEKSR